MAQLKKLNGFAFTQNDDFGYRGNNGPSHWASSYSYCAGELQSPIDIEENEVKPIRLTPLVFKGFQSIPKSMTLINNGHTVKLEIHGSPQPTLSGGPLTGSYIFSQLHFHWGANDSFGSEDLINNRSFPMELHMVFYKKEYGDVNLATNFKDGLCVVSVFYEVYNFNNTAYSEIVEHLDSVREPYSKKTLKSFLTLDDLLPSNKHLYYTYNGSLTTPPCYEVVTWLNFKEPIPLSHFQMAKFRKLKSIDGQLTDNFRPVQPLGNRTILFNVGERPIQAKHYDEYNVDEYQGDSAAKMTSPYYLLLIIVCFKIR
ncbi:hypothetical protein RUM43_000622 [Polyplax serrata]|uniref:carbonic anhydrase n=1 Tax=Polyplax serrata TaxID=468196 RepID=A0AAN8SCS2_POLSC